MENEKERKKEHDPHEEDVDNPAEEQGISPDENSEQIADEMQSGERPEDPLTQEGRETLVDEDAMEPWEAAFADGASDEGQHAKDALTGKPIVDPDNVFEMMIEGKLYFFENEENAQKFREKKLKEEKEY